MGVLNQEELTAGGLPAYLAGRGLGATNRRSRLRNYAHAFMMRGVRTAFDVMPTPPTLTKGLNTTSSVNTNFVNTVQYAGQDGRLSWKAGTFTDVSIYGGILTRAGQWTTSSTAVKTGQGCQRVGFVTDAEAVDFAFLETNGLDFNVLIDGQFASRSKPFGFANSGNMRWVKADLGANAVSYALDNPPAISAGGTGYAVNDVITLNGGTNGVAGTAAQLRVAQVSSGVVTIISVEKAGSYTTQPTGTFSQASTTGAGTGATFSAGILAKRNSTRKLRTWELELTGAATTGSFLGIALPAGRVLLPAPENLALPKIVFVGDSITAHTYQAYAGTGLAETVSQMLGLWERHVVSAQGGTGWNTDSGTFLRWSHATRLADIVALAPDIIVFTGSQNDPAGTALEDAIAASLTTLQTALPDTLFVGIGNIMGDSTTLANSIGAGWARAPDQTRVRYLNNHSPYKWITSANIADWQTAGDANHPHDDGLDWFAKQAATQIGNAILEMALTA